MDLTGADGKEKTTMNSLNLSQYAVKGSESEWSEAIAAGAKSTVSIKT